MVLSFTCYETNTLYIMSNTAKRSILLEIQKRFETLVATKSTWGKKEIITLYMQAQRDVLMCVALPKEA